MPLQVETYAKINLTLGVTGLRSDGYHLLETVMQSISLADRITLEAGAASDGNGGAPPGIRVRCSHPDVPLDSRNTAWKAAERFFRAAGLEPACTITIAKRIPAAAGLAGGSGNAAGVLAGLDALFPGRLTPGTLLEIAADIGADVPFCLTGGTQLCTGIGEIRTPLRPLQGWPVLLAAAPFGLSTPSVFQEYDRLAAIDMPTQPDHGAFLPALAAADWPRMAASAANCLEAVAFARHPELAAARQALEESGAAMARMSGSGPTLYAVYMDDADLHRALSALPPRLPAGFSLLPVRMAAAGVHLGAPVQP